MVEEYAPVGEFTSLSIVGTMPTTKDVLADLLREGARRLLA